MEDETRKFSSLRDNYLFKRIFTYEGTIEPIRSFISSTLDTDGISVEIKHVAEKNGLEEGEMIGLKKGIKIGEKKGLIEAARRMIAMGMDPMVVCNTLDLSLSDL